MKYPKDIFASSRLRVRVLTVLVAVLAWPVHASEIHRGLGPEPDALDIHLAQGLAAVNVLRDLHEGLITFNAAGELISGVARQWENDGDRWTFRLDERARWSSGDPVTASDFVRGWRRAVNPATAAPMAGMLDVVENAPAIRAGDKPVSALGIRALDEHTLEVTLARPAPWFREVLAHPVTYPLPRAFDEEAPAAVGNGAFVLESRVPGGHLRLGVNAHFREAGELRVRNIVWYPIESPSVELSRFRAGELHITESIPPGRAKWLQDNFGDELRVTPYLGSFFLTYNLSRPPFREEPKLREALSLAVNREIIAERVIGAGEIPARRLVPPGMSGWPENETLPFACGGECSHPVSSQAERIARARELYREAGYGPEKALQVELRFNSSLTHRRMAAAVAAMWKQALGVETRLINEEWKVFVVNRRQGRITQVVRGGWIADYRDPANFLQLFESNNPLNYSFYADPVFDEHLAKAASSEGDDRLETLWRAEQRLLDNHVIIPLYYYVSRHLVRRDVGGFEDNLMDVHLSRWLYLKQ